MELIAIAVFVVVMIAIMTEKIHRTTAALGGAVVLLASKVLTLEKGIEHIDFDTIGVLIGMMLFVAVVKRSGAFEYISIKIAKMAKGDPWKIMMIFTIVTAIISAFLNNVTTVLLMGPMVISIAKILKLDPVPFLLLQIMASNIGGTATLIGDPPNIMIASAAKLSFMDFILNNGIIVAIIVIALIIMGRLMYGKRLSVTEDAKLQVMELDETKAIVDRALMNKSFAMTALVIVGFMTNSMFELEPSIIALGAGVIMLLIGKQEVDYILEEIEWSTILFFVGLFIIVGGLVETGVIDQLAKSMLYITAGHPVVAMLVLVWASAFISAVLDNIPFVATLIPLLLAMGRHGVDITPLWWAISLGACLGGNGTLVGASANVVLCNISGKHGYPITFKDFLKVGMPIMIVTVLLASIYLLIRF